jgi:hypothetical protein
VGAGIWSVYSFWQYYNNCGAAYKQWKAYCNTIQENCPHG